MKIWSELEGKECFYLADVCNTTDDNENDVIIPKHQKLKWEYIESNELLFIVADGELKGFELYFYTNRDKPEDLLTEDEYRSIVKTIDSDIKFSLSCSCGEKIEGLFGIEDQYETLHCDCGFQWNIRRPWKEIV